MLKATVFVLAAVVASSAMAAGWRDLRIDASSEDAFARSLDAFKAKLSSSPRAYVFGEALKDIWIQGAKAAEAAQRKYSADEYYKAVDGLSYEEVVTLTDPTGAMARQRHQLAMASSAPGRSQVKPEWAGLMLSSPYFSSESR
jgi:hypothetical protein